jgi:hypothetical protein
MLKKFIKFLNIKHSMAFSKNSPDLKKKYENIDDVSFPFLNKKSHSKQNFEYFLVLDFEATCDSDNKKIQPQVFRKYFVNLKIIF